MISEGFPMSRSGLALVVLGALASAASAQSPEGVEYFEKHIRPLFVENCYQCHSAETMALGGLTLDSREALLKGGSRGAALVPGEPGSSLLVQAVSYSSLALRMPPTGRLADEEIEHIEAWVRMGAPDPRSGGTEPQVQEEGIDLVAGRHFWSFRPVANPSPGAVKDESWVRGDIDRFILARLEAAGLAPAGDTDRLTLLRRLTFSLTGLPPTPAEIESFLSDTSQDAYERVADRLLASPHYGERWGRHWLDLVRWAETNGHEFDNNKLDAWRYRDYVIESFNSDLPYSHFLREQIAGDGLSPRLSADGTHYVNPIASGMYWLWEVLNSPTDSVKARADQIDNQIDVLSKATQGLTIACARCHDHKFDPIPTADYYSLFGILGSTHMSEVSIDSPEREREIGEVSTRITNLNKDIARLLRSARKRGSSTLAQRLEEVAAEINSDMLSEIGEELRYALREPSHWLYPFARSAEERAKPDAGDFADWMSELRAEMADWTAKASRSHPIWAERGDDVYEDFEGGFGKWEPTGVAFGGAPVRLIPPGQRVGGFGGQAMASSFGGGSASLVGTLTTEKFRMPARYVHVRLAGPKYPGGLRENAPVRFTVIADEHKSGHAMADGSGRLQWRTIAMTKERGRICSIEIIDRDRTGSISVDQVVFSSSPKPPPIAGPVDPRVLALVRDESIRTLAGLARAYQDLAQELASQADLDPRGEALLNGILALSDLEDASEWMNESEQADFSAMVARRRDLDASIPESAFAMSSRDWMPADSPIHLRGNHENPGEIAPRRFLQVIAGSDQAPFRDGSGRVSLAEWIASESNPLTPRVMANRVWQHHFGRGIVPTPDDFGRMGEEPSHPELLDYLARQFMESGWSVKHLQRLIVLSSTYRAHSNESDLSRNLDPSNRLLAHFPVRRLEAEAIRDSMLSVSGSIDPTIGGPGVTPHISEYQDGRGKPESGPLDGLGRRSVYVQVRRNFLPPLFLAFDYPLPISTAGRRGVSAVASQALLMLNNEFVNGQAAKWAGKTLDEHGETEDRIRSMYLQAFGRAPVESEFAEITGFLSDQATARGGTNVDELGVWTDLAHVMFNTAEFVFVR